MPHLQLFRATLEQHFVSFRVHLHLQSLPARLPSPLGQTVFEDVSSETERVQPGHAHVSVGHPGHLGQERTGPQVGLGYHRISGL